MYDKMSVEQFTLARVNAVSDPTLKTKVNCSVNICIELSCCEPHARLQFYIWWMESVKPANKTGREIETSSRISELLEMYGKSLLARTPVHFLLTSILHSRRNESHRDTVTRMQLIYWRYWGCGEGVAPHWRCSRMQQTQGPKGQTEE
jgi:hypothetical protein